jgi:hypothetical protein
MHRSSVLHSPYNLITEGVMSSDLIGAAILASGIWVGLAVGAVSPPASAPRPHIWVVTASEGNPLHPDLMRAAPPVYRDEVAAGV